MHTDGMERGQFVMFYQIFTLFGKLQTQNIIDKIIAQMQLFTKIYTLDVQKTFERKLELIQFDVGHIQIVHHLYQKDCLIIFG